MLLSPPTKKAYYKILLFLVLLSIFLYHFSIESEDSHHCYPIAFTGTAAAMCGKFDILTSRSLPDLIKTGSGQFYSSLNWDQRLGLPVLMSSLVCFYQFGGYRIFEALMRVVAGITLYAILIYLFKNQLLALIITFLFSFNSIFSIPFLSPNSTMNGVVLLAFLILIMGKEHPGPPFVAGLCIGTATFIIEISILIIPGIVLFIFLHYKKPWLKLGAFFIGLLITLFPWLYWHHFAFGTIFSHETQGSFKFMTGLSEIYIHKLGPISFKFDGFLNYPFYHKVVRTPDYPYPNYLLHLLSLYQSLGLILFSFMIVGVLSPLTISSSIESDSSMVNFFKRRRYWLLILFWFLAYYFAGGVQENLEEQKTLFVLWIMSPVFILIANGCHKIFSSHFFLKKFLYFCLVILITILIIYEIRNLNFEADPRHKYRFHREEANTPEMLKDKKTDLTTTHILPDLSFCRRFYLGFREYSYQMKLDWRGFIAELKSLDKLIIPFQRFYFLVLDGNLQFPRSKNWLLEKLKEPEEIKIFNNLKGASDQDIKVEHWYYHHRDRLSIIRLENDVATGLVQKTSIVFDSTTPLFSEEINSLLGMPNRLERFYNRDRSEWIEVWDYPRNQEEFHRFVFFNSRLVANRILPKNKAISLSDEKLQRYKEELEILVYLLFRLED